MNNEFKLDIRIYEFGEGGYIVAEVDSNGEHSNPRAVSTLTEAMDAMKIKVQRWNTETQRMKQAQLEDAGAVVPRKWWRRAGE